MTKKNSDNLKCEGLLHAIKEGLSDASPNENVLRKSAMQMSEFADHANEQAQMDLFQGAEMLSRILELAVCWKTQFPDDPKLVDDLVAFVVEQQENLNNPGGDADATDKIDAFIESANDKWGEYLILVEGDELQNDSWPNDSDSSVDSPWQDGGDDESIQAESESSGSDIEMMLAALSNPAGDIAGPLDGNPNDDEANASNAQQNTAPAAPSTKPSPAKSKSSFNLADDRELLEAYLDDANRCVSSMEQAAMAIEENPEDKESVQQFCRELHTLKGASATVGLSDLASYLHELESSLESMFAGDSEAVESDKLFESIDRVREKISSLSGEEPATEPNPGGQDTDQVAVAAPRAPEFANLGSNDESSVRIRASKLDRLMDMLAELVVLRNRRESHVAEFNAFNSELATCAARLSHAGEESAYGGFENIAALSASRNTSNTVTEVSKDIAAVSRGMRELQEPVVHDNAAISLFIRDFRQELMQLRRVPMSGLFRRLQRAARDVARTEKKQVQVVLIGENAGLEQEIQERLFESLIHIVRNSVSHGVETAEHRRASGKPDVGTLTLEAYSTAQLLTIEVKDDGNGLDYEAIWRRAISKGLLPPTQRPTNDELSRLIFHPGFSTREQASEVSGRGVGMDVVARTIEQLNGRIEVDSVAGVGTTMRLLIPLRTGIEHVMVFRSEGQLFALPMQAVTAAKSTNSSVQNLARLSLSSTSRPDRKNDSQPQDVLLLTGANQSHRRSSRSTRANESRLALAVDELIGPEEVVVRGLPNLLKSHPLFCGVTLSGSGEKVLLLDSERIEEFCQQQSVDQESSDGERPSSTNESGSNKKRVLVVDDSLTVRRALVKILKGHDFITAESGDGIEAIERLHREQFDLVLTDLDMPRLGGLELLSDIQAGRYCEAPVVVVSSRDEETFRMKALDAGAADYITKPVSKSSITQLLERIQLLSRATGGRE